MTKKGVVRVTRPSAVPTSQINTTRTRVIRWDFVPGAETTLHLHEYDYVVVPLTSGRLAIEGVDGSVTNADLTAGSAYNRAAGAEHNVVNDNDHDFAFVEIEFLT